MWTASAAAWDGTAPRCSRRVASRSTLAVSASDGISASKAMRRAATSGSPSIASCGITTQCSSGGVAHQQSGQIHRDVLVKQNAHRPGGNRGPSRARPGPAPVDRRGLVQEFVEGFATFEIVEQRLRRYASPHKDRSSTEDIRVSVDDGDLRGHGMTPAEGTTESYREGTDERTSAS